LNLLPLSAVPAAEHVAGTNLWIASINKGVVAEVMSMTDEGRL
jgi:hypothetical protein